MKKTLKEAASSFNYLSGIKDISIMKEDEGRGAVFPKDHPLHDPNFPGIENTSQAVTIDGKKVDTGTIELDGTEMIQRYGIDDALPDIFASAAQFTDGTELNDEQLSKLTDDYPETIEQIATQMMEEGSCGYSIEGKPANKPAGPHLLKKGELNESVQRMKKLAGIKNK